MLKIIFLCSVFLVQNDNHKLGFEQVIFPSYVLDIKYIEMNFGPETRFTYQLTNTKKCKPYISIGTGFLEFLYGYIHFKEDSLPAHVIAFSPSTGIKLTIKEGFDFKLGVYCIIAYMLWEFGTYDLIDNKKILISERKYDDWDYLILPEISFRFY